jgi:hypothetical protein
MAKPTLEERIKILEEQVAQLKLAMLTGNERKDWRKTIGMFTGDEIMKQIDEEARRFREADRRKARRRKAKRRQVKP